MKHINVKLNDANEREQKIIEFLEDKPVKFFVVSALEMYMKAYQQMEESGGAGSSSVKDDAPKNTGLGTKFLGKG